MIDLVFGLAFSLVLGLDLTLSCLTLSCLTLSCLAVAILHILGQSMSSPNIALQKFLEGLQEGWFQTYGPTLLGLGLDNLQHADNMTLTELKELLQAPLEHSGAPPFHVARIIKSLHYLGSTNSDKISSPTLSGPTQASTFSTTTTAKAPDMCSGIRPHVDDKPDCQPQIHSNSFKLPDHFVTWSDVTVAVHTLALQHNKEVTVPLTPTLSNHAHTNLNPHFRLIWSGLEFQVVALKYITANIGFKLDPNIFYRFQQRQPLKPPT